MPFKNALKNIFKQLRTNIIAGILLIFPLFISIFIIVKVFGWVDSALPGVFGVEWTTGFGAFIILLISYFTGLSAKNFFGKKIIATGNAVIANIPVLNKIYLSAQQIVDTIGLQNKKLFERVVLIEYPKENCYSVGFVTCDKNPDFSKRIGQDLTAVFIPTTPNPTSGFLLYYPESEITDLNIPVELGIKRVMSAGMLSDEQLAQKGAAVPKGEGWNWTKIFKRSEMETMFDPRD
ncbi:MAG: DUF502 domain-containing protein [Chitinispirillaceae bacterium]